MSDVARVYYIITDKYRVYCSNVGDTVCLSVDDAIGDDDAWENVVNVPLHYLQHAEKLEIVLSANINACAERMEAQKASSEEKKPPSDTSTDFWSGS